MSAKPVFSLNDLQKGAKSLNPTETTSHGSKDTSDVEARRALGTIYIHLSISVLIPSFLPSSFQRIYMRSLMVISIECK